MKKKYWKVWKYALGSYEDTEGHDDAIAYIRTTILLVNLLAASLIIINIISGWT
tara:strand:+ start:1134 stop:1295 length:162 start_codon:yes stop_codon:yes gene_type:complete